MRYFLELTVPDAESAEKDRKLERCSESTIIILSLIIHLWRKNFA
jgi:hypothetical protein